MTLEGTPSIVSPSGIANLQFLDEAATANRYARELRRRHGVKAIVVLLHEGGFPAVPFNTTTVDDRCTGGISGPILDIVENTTDDVDALHHGPHPSGLQLRDRRPPRHERELVRAARSPTSTSRSGATATSSRRTPGPSRPTQPESSRHARAAGDRPRYDELSAAARREPVGRISADIRAAATATCPMPRASSRLGNLIADAQLADTKAADAAERSRADEPGRRARRPAVREQRDGGRRGRARHLRGGLHGPAVQQPRDHPDVHGAQLLEVLKDQWCGANTARRCCCRRRASTTRCEQVGRRRRSSATRARARRTRSAA